MEVSKGSGGDGSQESLPCDSNQKEILLQLLSLGSLGVEKPGEVGRKTFTPGLSADDKPRSTPLTAYTSTSPQSFISLT